MLRKVRRWNCKAWRAVLAIWCPMAPTPGGRTEISNGTAFPSYRTFCFSSCGAAAQRGSWPLHSWGFQIALIGRATFGRTSLDEWSARRRDLYLTTHNTTTNIPALGGIRTHNFSRRTAADLRLRQRGHRDRLSYQPNKPNTWNDVDVFFFLSY
jgi:hypothetical protein